VIGRRRRRARARRPRTGGFETTVGVSALLALLLGVRPGLVALVVGFVVALDVAGSVARRRRRRRRLRVLKGFLALSPGEFEQAVAELLRRMGYGRVRVVGGAGDLCADITCRDPAGRRAVVQCKRWGPGHHVGLSGPADGDRHGLRAPPR
jgi:membrane protein implicated in regulation of membrane protease activity